MDSPDDSLPLILRVRQQTQASPSPLAQPAAAPAPAAGDEDDEDLPDWVHSYKSPYTGGYKPPPPAASSDEEDVVDLTAPTPTQAGTSKGEDDSKPETQPKGRAGPASPLRGKGRKGASAAAAAQAKQEKVAQPKSEAGLEQEPMDIAQASQEQGGAQAQPGGTQQDNKPGKGGAAAAGGPGPSSIAQQLALEKGEVPLVLPERLLRNKVLVELGGGVDDHVVDLAGDAGAVGRIIVVGKSGSEELSVDLKGVLFSASIHPLAGSALVVNIQPTEAKVEAIVNDFVRLAEQRGLWGEDEGVDALGDLYADDDEVYGGGGGGGGAGGEGDDEEGGEGGKKKKKKAAAAGAGKGKGAAGSGKKAGARKAGGGKGGGKGAGSKGKGKGGAGKKLGVKGGVAKKKPAAKKPAKAAKPKGK